MMLARARARVYVYVCICACMCAWSHSLSPHIHIVMHGVWDFGLGPLVRTQSPNPKTKTPNPHPQNQFPYISLRYIPYNPTLAPKSTNPMPKNLRVCGGEGVVDEAGLCCQRCEPRFLLPCCLCVCCVCVCVCE